LAPGPLGTVEHVSPSALAADPPPSDRPGEPASAVLERALKAGTTLHGLVEAFEEKGFAVAFVVLLGVPALPLPTGGATHVFEAMAALLALELVAGRETLWLPRRWREVRIGGGDRERFVRGLLRLVRGAERISKPRQSWLLRLPIASVAYGLFVIVGSAAAFFAPPFTGLDTLPALGVVLVSLGVLLDDFAFVIGGCLVTAAGIALELTLGAMLVDVVKDLL
jgi:hypothetical protein